MMEAMTDLVHISSPDRTVSYMNPAMVKRTGHDATGETCYKAINGLDDACPWCELDRTQTGEPSEIEIVSPKDGRSYRVTNSPIPHADGTVSKLTIHRDITVLKRMEEESLRAQKLEATGVLAGGIAHDLNNILTVIMGHIDLARSESQPGTGLYGNLFEAENSCLQASDLARRFIAFSRGGSPLKESTSLSGLVDDVVGSQPSGGPFTYDISRSEDLWALELDVGQIKQVIIQLLTNAKEAMPEGGLIEIDVANHMVDDQTTDPGLAMEEGEYVKLRSVTAL